MSNINHVAMARPLSYIRVMLHADLPSLPYIHLQQYHLRKDIRICKVSLFSVNVIHCLFIPLHLSLPP